MKKVITYGTYDLLHFGHIRLLERAKALGDYLIVGVTAEDFDKVRGKINVQQSLMERIEAVKATGIADEIIVEEYEGQKIDDIKRYDVDIFTVGSDWEGYFDYLKEYCEVIYLDRTQGVSSSQIRTKKREVRLGLIGGGKILEKYCKECKYVNGISVSGICSQDAVCVQYAEESDIDIFMDVNELIEKSDALYIIEAPRKQYGVVKQVLNAGKHVLCEAPIALREDQLAELYEIAEENQVVLMEAIKTAYATAYNRLQLLVKSGRIGAVISVDATCTSMRNIQHLSENQLENQWNSMYAWGPTALLPIFQLLGTQYSDCRISSFFADSKCKYDIFSKIEFSYPGAVASVKVGQGVKSEGELIISGTKGYLYVPAPWWKTDYFEIRYEDPATNKRYFYQLDGEGIRYELVAFAKAIDSGKKQTYIEPSVAKAITAVMEQFENLNINYIKKEKMES